MLLFKMIYCSIFFGVLLEAIKFIQGIPPAQIGQYALMLSLVVFCIGTGGAISLYKWLFASKSSTSSFGFAVPSQPDYYSYKQMHFKGIVWAWQWWGGKIENVVAFCPKCCQRLDGKNEKHEKETGHIWYGSGPIVYHCDNDNCDFETDYVSVSKVIKEIERRINSGEYKKEYKGL